jgi:hypothetical protein
VLDNGNMKTNRNGMVFLSRKSKLDALVVMNLLSGIKKLKSFALPLY